MVVLAMVSWAGTWTSGKITTGLAPVETIIFWRFVISSLCLVLIMVISREPFSVPLRALPGVLVSGLLFTAYNHFFLLGVRSGLAGTGGVVVASLNPVLTFLGSVFLTRRRPRVREIAGVALGIVGGVILLQLWRYGPAELLASGNLFFLLAAICWSTITIFSHRIQRTVSFMTYSTAVGLVAVALNFPFALWRGIWPTGPRPGLLWINIVFLATVAMAFATTVFFRASRRLGAERAASYIFMVPVLAPLISWLVLGEHPEMTTFIGGPLAIAAVYLINAGRREGG
jgi:drug/metabolite transporter (DMT)-like permease